MSDLKTILDRREFLTSQERERTRLGGLFALLFTFRGIYVILLGRSVYFVTNL